MPSQPRSLRLFSGKLGPDPEPRAGPWLQAGGSVTWKGTDMTRAVLCAIDEQTPAAAVHASAELASGLGSKIVLAHVAPARERGHRAAMWRGREYLERARRELPGGTQVGARVELGTAPGALLEIARDEDAELIVIGSRGQGALRSALLGSASRKLARQAPCPVVIATSKAVSMRARAHGSDEPQAGVVCGIDGSQPSLAATRLAADLAARLGDPLVLVHTQVASSEFALTAATVAGEPEVVMEQARAELGELHATAKSLFVPGPAAQALESVAVREQARLIVVGARDMGGLRSALVGSVSSRLAGIARCPVVVLPEKARLEPGSRHYETSLAA